MYFLSAALSGMRRRWSSTFFTIAGGAAIATAIVSVGLWSYWLGFEKNNLKANRTAAVFVDSIEPATVEDVLTGVLSVSGVETARIVAVTEFTGYLREHFPDLSEAVTGLGEDIIPRSLEVTLSRAGNDFERQGTVEAIQKIPHVSRVDDGGTSLRKAIASLRWLSIGGLVIAAGLWFVFLVVCLGHYQNVFYSDAQEIFLIRSFGATKVAILSPWFFEGLVQSALVAATSAVILFGLRNRTTDLYNQFFGTIGYEPLLLNTSILLAMVGGVFLISLTAHIVGSVFALTRGEIA